MRAIEIAKGFGIAVIEDINLKVRGRWTMGNEIIINPEKANEYVVLHEIGHVLAGYMCCREHAEYTAHGVAIGLARMHDIDITDDLEKIDVYAGRTLDCPADKSRMDKK